MKIFIDVDNTIIEHYGFYSYETESRIHRSIGRYPLDNVHAIKTMYETSICNDPEVFRKLMENDNVYILTKFPHEEYEYHKQVRIAEILGITREELLSLKDQDGNQKYICLRQEESKVEEVKQIFKIDSIKDFILIDDYSENLIEWEYHGGIAIKYYNEYNSPSHPTNGLSISNFKIFEYLLEDKDISCILLTGTNKYKLSLVEELLTDHIENKMKIDNISLIKKDLETHLKVDNFPENHKYRYLNFLREYYNFRNHVDKCYWNNKLTSVIDPSKFVTISTLFELPETTVTELSKSLNINILQMNILSMNNKVKPENVYDVYLTISDSHYVERGEDLIYRVCMILNKLIRHDINVKKF